MKHAALRVVIAGIAVASLSACTIGDVSAPEQSTAASSPQPTLPESTPEKEPPVIEASDIHEALEALAADNPGTGIAVAGADTVAAAGITDPQSAWSTAKVPLAIAGIMSDEPLVTVNEKLEHAKDAAHALGVNPGIDPFMTLSFMALPVIPSLRITTRGVFDVSSQRYI